MTAGNGEVVWSANYNSFGEATIEVETIENNLRFPGQYEDSETGLHYNKWRHYDPKIGRYIRRDPIGKAGGVNLFIYSLNNPLFYIDYNGKKPTPFNLFCMKKLHDAEKACGENFEQARKDFMDYLNWCACAWGNCKCGASTCEPNPSDVDCKKFNKLNSAQSARIACIKSPEGIKVGKYGGTCMLKIAAYIKCIAL